MNPLGANELGELCFRGPNLIRGYWNNPDATADTIVNGWLRSGDLGRVDDEGFVYIEDRVKDMVLRGGENIYCAEVEAIIYEYEDVHEAAVFGMPHDRLGEEVACAILPKKGRTLDIDALRAHLTAKLASFKVPSLIEVASEALPRNAAGKILKRDLREALIERRSG
jgi:long-chain acyl-CoA synthetase